MRKFFNLSLLLIMLLGAVWVFEVKISSENLAELIETRKSEIVDERDQIQILRAEWSLLNQPDRLQRLAERFQDVLQLDVPDLSQIATLDEIPRKIPRILEELAAR